MIATRPAVERRRLEDDADDLRDEAEQPDAAAEQAHERPGPPGLDAERHGGPLPQRRREREGDRGHDGENCCYLVHGAPR